MYTKVLPIWNGQDSLAHANVTRLNVLKKNKTSERYTILPNLLKLKQVDNHVVLFSPLLLTLFFTEKEKYEKLVSGDFEDCMHEFIDTNLIIPESFDIYPKRDRISVVISLSLNCNMKCIYCIFDCGEGKDKIDVNFVKSAIDFTAEYYRNKPGKILFDLSGGEPTLDMGKMKSIIKHAKTKMGQREYSFGIRTNGVFSKNLDKFLLNNMKSIALTCDGPPQIQNLTRPLKNGKPSSVIVEKTIKRLVNQKTPLLISSVINKYSFHKQVEIINYFHRLGANQITFMQTRPYGRWKDKDSGYDQSEFIDNYLKAKEMAEEYSMSLKTNALNTTTPISSSCIMGSLIHFDEKGEIYNCFDLKEMASRDTSLIDFYPIGYYDKKKRKVIIDNKENIEFLSDRSVEDINECYECFAKWLCGGGCPVKAFQKYRNFYRKARNCNEIKNTLMRYLVYKIEKHFIKIKPHIENDGNKLFFSVFFNKLGLNASVNGKNLKSSSLIKIDGKCNFKKLYKDVMKESKNRENETVLFLLSFDMNLNEYAKNYSFIISLLRKLKKNKVYFKVTKPLPRCLFNQDYSKITAELNVPKTCFDCLELFIVNDGKIRTCDGRESYLKNFKTREEIYNFFRQDENSRNRCKSCKLLIRGQCSGECSKN